MGPPGGFADGNTAQYIAGPYTFVKTDGSGEFTTLMHGEFTPWENYGSNLDKEITIPGRDGETIIIKGKYFVLGNWQWDTAHGFMSDGVQIYLDVPDQENGHPVYDPAVLNNWSGHAPVFKFGTGSALSGLTFFEGEEYLRILNILINNELSESDFINLIEKSSKPHLRKVFSRVIS